MEKEVGRDKNWVHPVDYNVNDRVSNRDFEGRNSVEGVIKGEDIKSKCLQHLLAG